MEVIPTLLVYIEGPKCVWDEAFVTACYIIIACLPLFVMVRSHIHYFSVYTPLYVTPLISDCVLCSR